MTRHKIKPKNEVKPTGPARYQMFQIEGIIHQLFMENYQQFKIKEYTFNISPDRTRIVLNAVIDTPFPTFEGVIKLLKQPTEAEIKTAGLRDTYEHEDSENSNSEDR